MNIVIYFTTLVIIFVILFVSAKKFGIKEFRLSLQKGIVLIREDIPDISISLGNYMGLVISQDGKIRKIHLNIVAHSSTQKVIDNFNLILGRKIKFRIKQFYTENGQLKLRYPDETIQLPLHLNDQPLRLRAEFETFDYDSF